MCKSVSSTRNQFLATFAVNIISISHGCAIGWLSPSLPYLRSDASHLTTGPVSSTDVSWIGSLLCIGGFFGAILFGFISQQFGKRVALIGLVFPHFAFWLTVHYSTTVQHLFIARVFAGITGGGALRTVSLFVAEISENKIRGQLGSYLILFLSLGTLVVFVAGNFLSFFVLPLVMLILPVCYLIAVSFLHNSPVSLMSRGKANEAWTSLKFYRSCGNDELKAEKYRDEHELLRKTLTEQNCEKLELDDFLTRPARQGLLLGMFLMFLNQYSGTMVIVTYTADIFNSSGSNFSPNESSIVVAMIQLLGVYISTICVEKFGRKILMIVSCTGASIFFCVLATYSCLKAGNVDVKGFESIPIFSLSLVILIASLGVISLPFVIVTELMPNKIRNAACTICMSGVTVLAFTVLKLFPPMVEIVGLHGCMWFFSAVCLLGTIITIFFIPETKGRSLIAVDPEAESENSQMLQPITKKPQIMTIRKK